MTADLVVGGVVPPGNPTYQTRHFESEALRLLTAGDWVTLLGPRQHGKSSALVRIAESLEADGIRTARVDFQAYAGDDDAGLGNFLHWLVLEVRASFGGTPVVVDQVASVQQAMVLACGGLHGSITIMFDEAGRLPENTRYQFYSQLRAYHTAARSGITRGDNLGVRLTLLFAGTFRPDTIIDDANSPFNVSRVLTTEDLTRAQVTELAEATGDASLAEWANRAYEMVGGLPYLIQAILDAVASASPGERESSFRGEIARILGGADGHLPAMFRRLAAEPEAEERLSAVVAAGPEGLRTSGDGASQFLEIVGAVRLEVDDDGAYRMRVRNALYKRAFEASPQISPNSVMDRKGVVSPEVRSYIAPLSTGSLDWITDTPLRLVVGDLHAGGVEAANRRHSRLALAGLGSALEGLLLARIEKLPDAKLENARVATTLASGKSPKGAPNGWTFEALSKVLIEAGELADLPQGAADMLRSWRNLVHPHLAREVNKTEKELEPLVAIMAACITIVCNSS